MTPEQSGEFAKVLPESLFLVTPLGEILVANRPATVMLGCSGKPLVGQVLTAWVTDPPEKVLIYLQACARSRQMVLGSVTLRLPNEELLICRTEGAVLQPATAEDSAKILLRLTRQSTAIGEFVLLNQKIDELTQEIYQRQQIEASLLRSNEELKQAQLRIVQREKMASLGNLVAGVAHEINNPIGFLNSSINNARDYAKDLLEHLSLYQQHYPNPATPIQNNAEDIDLEFVREDLPKLLNAMKAATDRIKGISKSLRTFSRADTEHKVYANLHEGIDSTLLILKYRLKANEFRPAIKTIQDYGDLPEIECFPGQLNQVFMNILANAIDIFDEIAQTQSAEALNANPQQITIQTEPLAEQVLIRIRDNGVGMSETVQARIFDHLFTTKTVGKGTGLGLTIARQIVEEKHGGKLKVQSAIGQGTEFYIYLPIHSSD